MKTYNYIDKTDWPSGPWNDEPDKMQWQDEATGQVCLIVRAPGGHLCGYVGLAEGHPFFEVDFDQTYGKADLNVHGGLTFSNFCHEGAGDRGICHIPEPGQPDRVWWLGFDCAHLGDMSPAYDRGPYGGQYRNLRYVKEECASLAKQLANINESHQASIAN